MFIPLIYFLSIGIVCIFRRSRPCFAITGVIYCILFAFFIRYYFIFFQDDLNKNSVYFSPMADLEESLTFVSSLERSEAWDGNIYIIGKSEPHIAAMLALDVDPYSFQKEIVMGPMDGQEGSHVVSYKNYRFMRYMLWSDIPHKNIYIFRDIHEIPWEIDASGFTYRQFNTMRVYYDPELFRIPE